MVGTGEKEKNLISTQGLLNGKCYFISAFRIAFWDRCYCYCPHAIEKDIEPRVSRWYWQSSMARGHRSWALQPGGFGSRVSVLSTHSHDGSEEEWKVSPVFSGLSFAKLKKIQIKQRLETVQAPYIFSLYAERWTCMAWVWQTNGWVHYLQSKPGWTSIHS